MNGEPVRLDVVCTHHRPDVALLLDAALPAARDARLLGAGAHVERHWLHGPHLRVRLTGPGPAVAAAADAAHERFTAHLAAHPTDPGVDAADLLARSEKAGRAELVPGPYTPIRAHATVHREQPDDRALAQLIGPAAVPHRDRLMAGGLDAVEVSGRALRAAGDTASARVRVALAAMTAHAAAYPQGVIAGSTSFLSHVEDFLHRCDQDGRLRARFAAAWDRCGDAVTDAVRRTSLGEHPDGLHVTWSAWSHAAAQVCRAAFAGGEIPLIPGGGYHERAGRFGDPVTAARWDPARRTGFGEFHSRLVDDDWVARIAEHFGPYRFATNVLYPLLVVCGVTPIDRYLAAHLLGEAAQRLAGTTWRDAPDGWPPVAAPRTDTVLPRSSR